MLKLLFLPMLVIVIESVTIAIFPFTSALAEIVPDATLRQNSRVNRQGNVRVVEGGTRRGGNLFHSFREFSVPTGGEASFQGVDSSVTNLFTRVTGSSVSRINGTIQVLQTDGTVSPANLFLLNPNGIVFGPNASLNIGGAFLATTADSISFDGARQFSAVNPQASPLLTLSIPTGLQFGSNPQPIINRSTGLQVRSGETLALVGGQISFLGGAVTSSGGRVELGAVGGSNLPTQVTFTNNTLALNYQNVQNFQDIRLSNGAYVDASGERGGDVQIRGRNVVLTDISSIGAATQGAEPGGTIDVGATQSIILRGGSTIATFTSGESRAGDVFLRASDSVQLLGTVKIPDEKTSIQPSAVGSQVSESATGNGGNVTVETAHLIAQDGGGIDASTFGRGQAGDIVVRGFDSQYADSVELSGVRRYTPEDTTPIRDRVRSGIFAQVAKDAIDEAGDAGSITINTRDLTLLGGAQISSAARRGGRGGDINVDATDSVTINGRSPDATETVGRSGIFASAEQGATQNAGQMTIRANQLTVENQGEISANNFGPARGGTINIDVNQLTVQNSDIRATSILSEDIEGEGLAGNILINANSITLDQGRLTAETDADNARDISNANIQIQSPTALVMQNQSQISARATLKARGGNVTILAPDGFVLATNRNNDIRADAVEGQGGNITIEAQSILGLSEGKATDGNITNDIDASSKFGLSGSVTLNILNVDPTQGLAELPVTPIDASSLIAQNCLTSGTVASTQSEFVITGRSGLPPSPTDPRSPADPGDWATLDESIANQPQPVITVAPAPATETVEAQGWLRDTNGTVTLVSEAPINAQLPNFQQRCPSSSSRN